MAIPTLTAVTPSTGLTRGDNVVTLTGTNFRIPPTPPATGYQGGEAQQTIRVTFAGVASAWAHALTATQALVRVPPWAGSLSATLPLAVDVRLDNLNDLGTEIATENVTRTNAYTYGRPGLAPERRLQGATTALVEQLRRHVLPNVHILAGRDYDDTTGTAARAPATLPALHLVGPVARLNRFDSADYAADTAATGAVTWQRFTRPVTVDLSYQILGWAQNPWHCHNLAQQVLLLFRQHPWLAIPLDPTTPGSPTERHQVEIEWENHPDFAAMAPATDDLLGWRAGVLVRGVHLADEPGIVIEQGWDVVTPALDGQGL